MQILHEYPPNIEAIAERFPLARKGGVLFAFSPIIYFPGGSNQVEVALLQHERCHMMQQGDDPWGWWDKYIADDTFRLEQEFEAHNIEYLTRLGVSANRKERRACLPFVASKLASPLYGSMISRRLAMKRLKKGSLHDNHPRIKSSKAI
jgi:hypothetical protein